MTEQVLKNYFNDIASAESLTKDIAGAVSEGRDTSYYKIADIEADVKFVVTTKHLIKLCLDVRDHKIKLEDLKLIAFALEASDYFTWNTNTDDGNRVCDAISNWSSPEINSPLTMDYVNYCAYYLESGEHR